MADMNTVARRNLRQYIQKSGLVGPDKHSALACLDELERDLDATQPAAAVCACGATCQDTGNGDCRYQPAAAGHGVIHATIRATNEDDVLHVECRFDDGQKYAAIEVSGHRAEELADTILSALTEVPAAAGELPEAVPTGHAMVNKFGKVVATRLNSGFGFNFSVADFLMADRMLPEGSPHTGQLLYTADQLRAAVAGYRRDAEALAASWRNWNCRADMGWREAVALCADSLELHAALANLGSGDHG